MKHDPSNPPLLIVGWLARLVGFFVKWALQRAAGAAMRHCQKQGFQKERATGSSSSIQGHEQRRV